MSNLTDEISGMMNIDADTLNNYRSNFDNRLTASMQDQVTLSEDFYGSDKTSRRLELNVFLRSRIADRFNEQNEYEYLSKAAEVNSMIANEDRPHRFWDDPYKAAENRKANASTVLNEINNAKYALAVHNLDMYAKTRANLDKDVDSQNYAAYGLEEPMIYGCLTIKELDTLVNGNFDPTNREALLTLDADFADVLTPVEVKAIRNGDWSIIGDTIRTTPASFRKIINSDKSDAGLLMFTMGIDGHFDISSDELKEVGYTRLIDVTTGNPAVNDWLDWLSDEADKESTLRSILQNDVRYEIPGAIIKDGKVLPSRLIDRDNHLWIHEAETLALQEHLEEGNRLER